MIVESILALGIATQPIDTTAIQILEEQAIVQTEQPEPTEQLYTIQENETLTKIAAQYQTTWQRLYNKNLNLDNPDLLEVGTEIVIPETDETLTERVLPVIQPQPVSSTTTAQKPVRQAPVASSGWYEWGWCTFYISTQRPVGQWNNASEWVWQARRDGWATGSTPRVGAIAQRGNHVAIVRSVSGGQMTIQEMNYRGFGVISSRTISSSGWTFIY